MTTQTILQAAEEKNHRLLKSLIQSQCHLDEVSDHGFTALMFAIKNRDFKCLKILIRGGASINTVNQIGRTALIYAAQQQNVECLKRLIKAGANLELADDTGVTALMASIIKGNVDCIRVLIEAGANLNARVSEETTLTVSLLQGNIELFKLLLTAGASVDVTDTRGNTALMVAAEKGLDNHVNILLDAGASTNLCNNAGNTALMLCVDNDHIKCVQLLISAGANINMANQKGENSLIKAVHRRELLSAFLLLEAGADINFKDSRNRTVLMHILMEKDVHTIRSARNKLFIRLVENGADVNAEDDKGMTTLAYALNGKFEVCDPNVPGKIPEEDCVKMLLNYGGDISKFGEQERAMLNYTVKARGPTLINLQFLLKRDAKKLNENNDTGKTAMMLSIIRGDNATCKTIMHAGVDINTKDDRGHTALMYAVMQDTTVASTYKLCEMLVIYGADVNAQNDTGMTALMFAAKSPKWNTRVIDLLVQNGANLELTDNSLMTALIHILDDTSSRDSKLERATCLLKYGANPLLGCHKELLAKAVSSNTLVEDGNKRIPRWYDINQLIDGGLVEIIRCVVCNGLVSKDWAISELMISPSFYVSPFVYALVKDRIDIAKYFIANSYLTAFDVQHSAGQYLALFTEEREDMKNNEALSFVGELYSNPWPLVKLAFIAVSTALGSSPGRDERVTETPLPHRLKQMLMFQEPVSRLCVHQWKNIPFRPLDYYKQDSANSPLRYYWPCGQIQPLECDHDSFIEP